MYRALYDFSGNQKDCLAFQLGDQFTVLDSKLSGDWLLVQNGFGQIGYVPYNYVVKDNATHSEVLKSIDRAIEAIHYAAASTGGVYTLQQRENLQKLILHRRNVVEEQRNHRAGKSASVPISSTIPSQPKRPAPGFSSLPNSDSGASSSSTSIENKRSCMKREAPPPPPRVSSLLSTAQLDEELSSTCTASSSATSLSNTSPSPTTQSDGTASSSSSQVEDVCKTPKSSKTWPASSYQTPQCCNTPMSLYKTPDTSLKMSESLTDKMAPRRESLSQITIGSKSPMSGSPTKSLHDVTVPAFLRTELIEKVRRNTGLSYDKTLVAIETVVLVIGDRVPPVMTVMEKVALLLHKGEEEEVDLAGSHDAERLDVIFSELNTCKDDSQQRSWALHEDESIILEYLQELLSIIENAKPSICRKMISRDNYEPLHHLVQYYQMETRVRIRLVMLKAFGAISALDHVAISSLLYSVLPLELCRELQSNINDVERSSFVALVLTMLLSMGEDLPINHYGLLNEEFVEFLLDKTETPPVEDVAEQLPDLFTTLILAFNLHFRSPEENIVMVTLGERGTATKFTEKLMLLVNREDDPVRMFPHEPRPANALMKFLRDMYYSPLTSDLLYTNDAMVLIDIFIRHLSDLPAGDQVRSEYLHLTWLLLKNSSYREENYRREELLRCFNNILKEEDENSANDRIIVQQIFLELPELFAAKL